MAPLEPFDPIIMLSFSRRSKTGLALAMLALIIGEGTSQSLITMQMNVLAVNVSIKQEKLELRISMNWMGGK